MGEADRFIDRKVRKISLGDDTNALMTLVAIIGMIYICFGMIQLFYQMSQSNIMAFQYEILRWAILPAKLTDLSYRPWTIFTYMFVHNGVIITIVNLLWLWAFGSILQNVSGNRVIFPIFIYGGLAGALFFIATAYIVPSLHHQIEYLSFVGANASIMAIAAAVTTVVPKYRIFPMLNGGIPLWVISLVYLLISVGSHSSHTELIAPLIGGGLCGFLYMYSLERGYDWGKWMNDFYTWFITLFDPGRKKSKNRNLRDALFYKTGNQKPFERLPVVTQEKIDAILDKINKEGYNHLTDEEKSILKNAAREDF